jgi:hypothetical protein
MVMSIRKATSEDIPAIAGLYDEIHAREEAGETTTGWLRDLYPVQQTAADSVKRGDMFVQEDAEGHILGTGIINQVQVDVYSDGNWRYPADDDEIMENALFSAEAERVITDGDITNFRETEEEWADDDEEFLKSLLEDGEL